MPLDSATLKYFNVLKNVTKKDQRPINEIPLNEYRSMAQEYFLTLAETELMNGVLIKNYFDKLNDGSDIAFTIYRPRDKHQGTIVFFPGGGYIFNLNNHHVPCSKIAGISNCIVIVPTLPLAPEYNQLQIINKAYMFICLIYNNSCKYVLNVKDFFCVSGHSSGGNIAALISIKARDEQSFFMPKITHQLLMSPRVDVSREVGGEYFKWCEYQDADIMLNSETQAYFATQYIPAGMDPKSKELSPYYADLRELPPTTIIFGEFDGLRGDAEIYCQKLSESDVPVEKFMCLGQVHNTMICRKVLFSGKDPAELAGELMDQQSKLTYHINCKL